MDDHVLGKLIRRYSENETKIIRLDAKIREQLNIMADVQSDIRRYLEGSYPGKYMVSHGNLDKLDIAQLTRNVKDLEDAVEGKRNMEEDLSSADLTNIIRQPSK